ncbi:transcriptional regulator (plasmid) [Azospirillum sp. B510]|uniref:MarR family winged helix-turn-helix transcriptional regulator n=1 Tax=Azospirillum sp. (strain B510) TaxID=137722 RepID=UPI0001C4B809|nr:MarR family transcriptional regulator [Azospirillum sp. B510]BAI74594.1 transcriptional regulator [Azospirillum sp. B510]
MLPDKALRLPPNFGLHLFRASHLWRRAANAVLADSGLSTSAIAPLMLLAELGDGLRQRELAEEMGVEGPSLVRLLDGLEAAGLLKRREDPCDRRAKTLHMTDAGRELLLRMNEALNDVRQRLMAGVTEADLAACFRVLSIIEANAKREQT